MIVRIGNLFDSNAQTLVNTVNTVGVMGKGIALEFKKRFPEMHQDYLQRCARAQVRMGEPYLVPRLIQPWILNFPTKEHWRSVSRLSDIVAGLDYLEKHYRSWGVTSLAVPPLGCGQGGLDWRVVGPTLYRHLARLDIPVELYAPFGTPPDQLSNEFLAVEAGTAHFVHESPLRLSSSWIALAEILARIVQQPHHWPVGRTTFQKLAYFATEAGLPTGFEYAKGSFGPFSSDVKPLVSKLVNNGVIQEQRLGPMFSVILGPTFRDARDAHQSDLHNWEGVIERVADLMLRFRTTHQAEVAASVHFAAKSLISRSSALPTENEVLDEVMHWKQRRDPPLDRGEVALAIRALGALGWINLQPSKDLPVPADELVGA
jgi:uncharacterized protein YwgA/O-acetyl-ADP-ribose deacetylase (regulator of RNase III)